MMLPATASTMAGTASATDTAATTRTVAALAREAVTFFDGHRPGDVVLVTPGNEVVVRQTPQ